MQYRYLGFTGLPVSQISFGSYLTFGHNVDIPTASKLMQIAYDAEINLFDTAEVYAVGHAEEMIGDIIEKLKWPRDSYLLMTKVFWGGAKPTQIGLHRKHLVDCCHAALKRLKVEYIDFYICHRPDPNTPIEETLRCMHHLIQQGKILYWGTSEWRKEEILAALLLAKQYNLTPPSLEQFQYNMLERQKAEKEYTMLAEHRLGAVTTMPLAGGLLTGKYNHQIPTGSRFARFDKGIQTCMTPEEWDKTRKKLQKLATIANEFDLTMAQLAIAWCLKNNMISSVIVGASNEQQLSENLASIAYLERVDAQTLVEIDVILGNKPVIESNHYDYNRMVADRYV